MACSQSVSQQSVGRWLPVLAPWSSNSPWLWRLLSLRALRPVVRHTPALFDAPTRPDGLGRAQTGVDRDHRPRSVGLGWGVLCSCFFGEKFVQFQSREAQMALDRIDRALRYLGDVAGAQLAFDLQ